MKANRDRFFVFKSIMVTIYPSQIKYIKHTNKFICVVLFCDRKWNSLTKMSIFFLCVFGIFIATEKSTELPKVEKDKEQNKQFWWTTQIFVYPSISTYTEQTNFIYLCFLTIFVHQAIPMLCFFLYCHSLLFAVYVIYKFYFNNRHSIILVWCCSTHDN